MNELPHISDAEDFRRWRSDPDLWRPVVAEIARREGIDAVCPVQFKTGTNLVVDLNGALILKLFPPIYATQFESEHATLRMLEGRLSVPIPKICASGQENRWSWLILTRLNGTVGSDVWPKLSEHEQECIVGQIGETIREVQAVPPGDLIALEPSWQTFLAIQTPRCVSRHQGQGLPHRFWGDLAALVADAPSVLPDNVKPVILTGEWIPENLLLSETPEGWRLAAVIDFGDVMTGLGEYDLLGPSTFMCAGVPGRLRKFLTGYGMTATHFDAAMRRRLMTLMVLHRASDLRNVAITDWATRTERLYDLEDLIWPEVC